MASAFDLHTFAEYGKRGVLALLQDSTNVERSGYTPSERAVMPRLDEIFSRTKKKLFFSCFSSSIYRIRIALELARKHGRKVAIIGRSMMESTEIAQDLGYIDIPPGLVIHPGPDAGLPAGTADDPDQRHAGRADERAEPRRGGQPQARAHRCGRHGGAELAHHSRQREEHLPGDRPSVPARCRT